MLSFPDGAWLDGPVAVEVGLALWTVGDRGLRCVLIGHSSAVRTFVFGSAKGDEYNAKRGEDQGKGKDFLFSIKKVMYNRGTQDYSYGADETYYSSKE